MKNTLVDARPLIALFNRKDRYHTKAVEYLKNHSDRLVSTWPVITEVSHMLDFSVDAQIDFLTWISRGAIQIEEIKNSDVERIIELTRTYSNVPMDLADSSLILAAERLNIKDILTIDSDYYIYRTERKEMLTNIFL